MESRVFLDSFTLAWEQRKLGDIVGIYDGVHQTPNYQNSGVMFLSVENIATLKSSKFISEEDFKRDYKVFPQENDILMTRIGDVGTTNVVTDNGLKAYYVSLALLKYKSTDPYFLSNAIQSDYVQKGLANRTLKTAIPMKINKDEIGKVSVMLPLSATEQQQIGTCFRNLDNLITLHQCKESAFSEWKDSGFLQKHKTTWEQRKAKELCSISTGKSNTQDRIEDGKYPFYVRSPIVERSNRYLFDEEAVLTVGDGVGTGKVFHYVNGKYDLHQRVYRMFGFSEEISAKYFYYYFSNHFYDRVMAMTAKTSVDSVRYEMIADMEISLPNKQEQICISMLFEQLDNLITLHQRKPFCINRRQKWKQTTKMQNYSANIMQNGFQYIRKGR